MTKASRRRATKLSHLGRDPQRFAGVVNPPVFRASTVLSPDLATHEAPGRRFRHGDTVYGRFGTPTHHALEDALRELEGGADCVLFPSGLSAIATALLAVLKAGDHVLVTDAVYGPTRKFCEETQSRFGIETGYIAPTADAAALSSAIRENTRALLLESPGSMTFEVQDVPALARAAKDAGLAVLMDNTWATPWHFQPLAHGVDLSIQAATKYIVGHADAMLGAVTANEAWAQELRAAAYAFGVVAGSEEVYLGLRGLRTLEVRLARHAGNALAVAEWLESRPEVAQVLYPPLPSHPQHALWARDFGGASGLLGLVLAEPWPHEAVARMVDGLELFGIGASWGGFESLVIAGHPPPRRRVAPPPGPGPLLRLHIGLEDPADLIDDLAAGFERLHAGSES